MSINSVINRRNAYECDVCKRVFTRQLSLNEHKYIHTDSKPFQCLKCGKTFRQSSNFQKHQKLHRNESQTNQPNGKTIVCKVCGRLFARESYLNSHLLSHNSSKTCLCHKCGNTFKYKCDLIRHMKIHENSRNYKCVICQMGFNDGSALRRHERKLHSKHPNLNPNPNQCQQSIDSSHQSMAKTSDNNNCENSSQFRLNIEENVNNINRINSNEMNTNSNTGIELNVSHQMSNNLNENNYLNSVIDYINVARILPQPLPSHIFEKVVDLQKEIALHLGIGRKCSPDYYNILSVSLQDLNAIVLEHLQISYKIND